MLCPTEVGHSMMRGRKRHSMLVQFCFLRLWSCCSESFVMMLCVVES